LIQCDSESAINAVAHGSGTHHGHAVFAGDIFEERLKIDFLLVLAADGGGRGLANDCDDGLVVHLGVVKTVQKVNRAGATGGHAYTHGAGELCVGASHEGRQLFVPGLDEAGFVAVLPQAGGDAIDAITGESVDALDAPFLHTLHDVLANCD
jgi:hypothetical protein